MHRRWLLWTVVGVVALSLWGGYLAYRAHSNLVTLDVRQMEVRKVVSKIQWQTWERIIVHQKVGGKVTLNVRSVPLEEVLNIIALQTSSRWSGLYPLYTSGKSVVTFKKVVRGEIPPEGNGWTNLFAAPSWRRSGNSTFANTARAANNLVSATLAGTDLDFAALALSRFSQAQVVPEDGSVATINLSVKQVPFEDAVAKLAKQARRKYDHFYTLQAVGGIQPTRVVVPPDLVTVPVDPGQREQARAEADQRQFDAMVATMTPVEREKAEEQRAQMQEIRSLPPAERQQRMQDMRSQSAAASQSTLQQRMDNRLKNSTPEQRIDGDRVRLDRRRQSAANPTP